MVGKWRSGGCFYRGDELFPKQDSCQVWTAKRASAAYLQFYFLVTKNKAPGFCEYPSRGELFFPTRSNQMLLPRRCLPLKRPLTPQSRRDLTPFGALHAETLGNLQQGNRLR